MSELVTMTLKIPTNLKEKIRVSALEAEHSLSADVCARLAKSFDSKGPEDHPNDDSNDTTQHGDLIDNQNTQEQRQDSQLSEKELRDIRKMLSTKNKKTKNKEGRGKVIEG
ncbi:hypothetical protein LLS47_23895 [Rouxiella badensis]|uniref:hypothetical protein n=1 Tax=Yersiniaceae TaxID=1903411 RepID=UPI001D152D1E|nr:hypothetical protein [Rouxiella badensis]MCC3705504.1 hypothetical protein [Rouxiella badensis]MCC3735943.1 hypothetical protein [Rouxiella badensis]MCC3742579.1 hypothetical protein [Rouxiella badensis]MCC3761325.1 hypothetical protein [Rouxiella badensis]